MRICQAYTVRTQEKHFIRHKHSFIETSKVEGSNSTSLQMKTTLFLKRNSCVGTNCRQGCVRLEDSGVEPHNLRSVNEHVNHLINRPIVNLQKNLKEVGVDCFFKPLEKFVPTLSANSAFGLRATSPR